MKYGDKTDEFEAFLASLNLAVRDVVPPPLLDVPPVSAQIVGLPRSGTTLVYQLLARTGEVGYPSNVMAFFHEVPWVGARLQRQLSTSHPTTSFESIGGRTREPLDPHEFGYFWRRVCGHDANSLSSSREPFDATRLKHELDLVASVFQRPVVYKNFLAMAHAPAMRAVGGLQFSVVIRDSLDVAASLLQLRRSLGVPASVPFAVQPRAVAADFRSGAEIVAWQVAELEADLAASGLTDANATDVIVARYAELCRNPREVIGSILEMMGAATAGVAQLPVAITPAAPAQMLSREERAELDRALTAARERRDAKKERR